MSDLRVHKLLWRRHLAALTVSGITLLFSCGSFAQSEPLAPPQAAELLKLYQAADASTRQAGDLRQKIEIQNAEIAAIKQALGNLEREAQSAANELGKLEKVDRDSPGVLRPEVLEGALAKSRRAANDKTEAQAKLSQEVSLFDESNKALAKQAVEEDHAKAAYLSRFEQVADGVLTERINEYKKPQEVSESASVACGDLSVPDCKAKSKQEAERKAIERGSVIVVDSITEINNLTLTKDKARSEVRGTITQLEIVESKLVADDTTAYTSIKATVTPGITEALRDEILQSVRADMSAQIGDGGLATQLVKDKLAMAANTAAAAGAATVKPDENSDTLDSSPLAALRNLYNRRDEQRAVTLNVLKPVQKIGGAIELTLASSHPGYVYLLMVGSDGNAFDMIFPNKIDAANSVRAGETIHLPRSNWQLLAQGPAGNDHLLAIVSDAPRDFSKIGLNPSGPFSTIGYSKAVATDIQLATGLSANAVSAACSDSAKRRNLVVGVKSCSNAYGAAFLSLEEAR
jgi:hypothetical protein